MHIYLNLMFDFDMPDFDLPEIDLPEIDLPEIQWIDSYVRDGNVVSGHFRTVADDILSNNLSY